jgi:hypothetical protein
MSSSCLFGITRWSGAKVGFHLGPDFILLLTPAEPGERIEAIHLETESWTATNTPLATSHVFLQGVKARLHQDRAFKVRTYEVIYSLNASIIGTYLILIHAFYPGSFRGDILG